MHPENCRPTRPAQPPSFVPAVSVTAAVAGVATREDLMMQLGPPPQEVIAGDPGIGLVPVSGNPAPLTRNGAEREMMSTFLGVTGNNLMYIV